MSEALKALGVIQEKLRAPKGQWNEFSKFHYRSCEDIVEAAKPLLAELNAVLVINDEVVLVGERYYVKATATVHVGGDSISTSALAREVLQKKGADEAQVTGATSSYARKYALNGLFAIDDSKDSDVPTDKKPVEKITDEQAMSLQALIDEHEIDSTKVHAWMRRALKVETFAEINVNGYKTVLNKINATIKAKQKAAEKAAQEGSA
jgi:hypothetical protein